MDQLAGGKKDGFEIWLSDRPKWLQTAAARLIEERKHPDQDGIRALADLCHAEANGTTGVVFLPVPPGFFDGAVVGSPFKLVGIDKVVGVNALKDNASLDFDHSDISVVFGMNGAGKSGFARLLKHACGARHKSDLLPNVFKAERVLPACEITVSTGTGTFSYPWESGSESVRALRTVSVFDSLAAESYVDSNNEASYEPRRMRFISSLIRICDAVSDELAARKAAMPSKFPTVPLEHSATKSAAFASGIRADTKPEMVEAACSWSAADTDSRQETERSLKQHDLAERIKRLGLDRRTFDLLAGTCRTLKSGTSDEIAARLSAAKSDAETKRKAATDDAAKVFAGASLDGIGSASWKLLWEQARRYSEEAAYPEKAFPATDDGDLCVLCHQPLEEGARLRMAAFESFVKGGLESAAGAAEKSFSDALGALPVLPDRAKWDLDMDFLKVEKGAGQRLFDTLENRIAALSKAPDPAILPVADWTAVDAALAAKSETLAKEKALLDELSGDGKKAELEKALKELSAREWLSQQKVAAYGEIARKQAIRAIEQAEALAKTNALTIKKNELAEEELAAGYRDRFLSELRALGGRRLRVRPEAVRQGKGKVSFKLAIQGAAVPASAGAVLSEGENRIVALAAFLADITGSGQPTPFVFDDPVSSLDQEFEERVVERLVSLAETRQVIVFTHRLSLLALIEEEIEARGRRPEGKAPVLSVKTLKRVGSWSGAVDAMDARHQKPKSGFANLRDQQLPRIRKHAAEGRVADYESALKAACGDFRILVEKSVEKELLKGLVERFRRSVQTRHIRTLANITVEDCVLIDELMTKYSRFEHSQSDDLPGILPEPEELAEDLDKVISWIDEYSKRKA